MDWPSPWPQLDQRADAYEQRDDETVFTDVGRRG